MGLEGLVLALLELGNGHPDNASVVAINEL